MSEDTLVKQNVAAGTATGAAVVLVTVGILQLLQGIAAVAKDEVFVVGINYTYKIDLTTWGWIHLVLGAVVALVGCALFTGATWSRVAAVIIAAVSILANFLWLPYYPLWAILIIGLDVVVIWAVSTWKPDEAYPDATRQR
ncbi:hypothetical protein CJ179_33680 [Rhodococcus sp. ACS1]|uniref:DUF7144 domain-containing protein n=1 Tax=Rhodococcus koreensis TaxID=99653 RepID=A0A1H4ICY0_9NOCA|nr:MULTISPECIES: hypothetical protein [Rhodococcus]PBC40047.1 hypothetical protein CJ179_33680 [Rhodococcus sp. ACS1]SEB31881.1 hypothetical protein SAMN04490239_0459 [Rhodococcus koreensis]